MHVVLNFFTKECVFVVRLFDGLFKYTLLLVLSKNHHQLKWDKICFDWRQYNFKRMLEWSDNALIKAKFAQNMSVD